MLVAVFVLIFLIVITTIRIVVDIIACFAIVVWILIIFLVVFFFYMIIVRIPFVTNDNVVTVVAVLVDRCYHPWEIQRCLFMCTIICHGSRVNRVTVTLFVLTGWYCIDIYNKYIDMLVGLVSCGSGFVDVETVRPLDSMYR